MEMFDQASALCGLGGISSRSGIFQAFDEVSAAAKSSSRVPVSPLLSGSDRVVDIVDLGFPLAYNITCNVICNFTSEIVRGPRGLFRPRS